MKGERLLNAAALSLTETRPVSSSDDVYLGVDLGTASIVLTALDREKRPVASEMEYASVIRDGLVVDYYGTMAIVKRLKKRLEDRLGANLTRAAIAVPPGTNPADAGTHRYVVEACNLDVTRIVDEPTAANEVLGVKDGVVVDIGGGTTGLTVFKNGEAVYTADEPTGGTHISLVLMGGRHITFEEAERLKRDPAMTREVMGQVKPVIQKMASIVKHHISGRNVDNIWLVGGTCLLTGIEDLFSDEIGVPASKPAHPHLVTPLGIAMSCL
ncbi:MAG: ethanolamine utilization protein EutJ [Clostridiales bacterium]|jgi:ethanolamine utilization protein EutJ|nr:ethanolamine utilization protein EutJ [Clostridiales bacterium]